jgi:hypothetical protein
VTRVIAAAGISVAVVCCSQSGSGTIPAVGVEFAARAVAACDAALAMKRAQGAFPFPEFNPAQPDPSKLAAVADFLMKTDATFTSWSASLKALGEPPGGRDSWDALIREVDRHVELNRDQIDAARKGDVTRFARDYTAGTQTQAALLAAATASGVAQCANVDR